MKIFRNKVSGKLYTIQYDLTPIDFSHYDTLYKLNSYVGEAHDNEIIPAFEVVGNVFDNPELIE